MPAIVSVVNPPARLNGWGKWLSRLGSTRKRSHPAQTPLRRPIAPRLMAKQGGASARKTAIPPRGPDTPPNGHRLECLLALTSARGFGDRPIPRRVHAIARHSPGARPGTPGKVFGTDRIRGAPGGVSGKAAPIAPLPKPMPRDRLVHIGRAGWQMPAMGPGDRGQRELIGAYYKMCAETADRRQNLHLACRRAVHNRGRLWQKYTGAPANNSA
jgi:hypothetical protein